MVQVETIITLKEGVQASLLVTPRLYGVAQRKGVDLHVEKGATQADALDVYERLIYCAAINAWEVARADDPELGEFPFHYRDFADWAWADRKEFMQTVVFVMEALRPLKDEKKK